MTATTPPSITALPAAPDPNDRTTFNTRAYPWSAALGTFTTEVGAVATNVYNNAVDAATSATTATTQAGTATTQAGNAATSATLAQNWASQPSGLVNGTDYSAKYYAAQAAAVVAAIPAGSINDTLVTTSNVWSADKVSTQLATKQATLVSGTSIKTINSTSLLGSGNLVIGANIATETRTSNTALAVADKGKLIDLSGSFTQTFQAAATLGAGWYVYLRVTGTSNITLDPNGSELIDGVTSGVIKPAMTVLIVCTGTAFKACRVGPQTVIEVLTSGTSWTCPIGVSSAKVTAVGAGCNPGGVDSSAWPGAGTSIRTYATSPATTYTYAIGATTSQNGGNTTFTDGTTAIAANGGTTSGAGNATGGHINVRGELPSSHTYEIRAGGSLLGFGACAHGSGGFTSNATGYGGGGCRVSSVDYTATAGVIVIEY